MQHLPRTQWLSLLVICSIAAGLRLYGLDVQSLWHDELFSWYSSQLDALSLVIDFGAAQDVHPPGFVIFMHFWQQILGDSELALRLPSALAGIAAVGWMYALGRRWFNTRIGLTSSALLAVSWMGIYFSQEARAYSLMLLGSIALTERIIAMLEDTSGDQPSKWTLGLIIFLAISLSYLHYFGLLFVALALGSWGLAIRHKRAAWRPWLMISTLTCAAYIPWIARVLSQIKRGEVWIPDVSLERVLEVYSSLSNQQLPLLGVLWATGLIAAVIWNTQDHATSRTQWLLDRCRSPLAWLVGWVTIPMLVTIAISQTILPVLTDRNLIIILPGMILISAVALNAIERWSRGKPIATMMVVALLVWDLFGTRQYYQEPTKWQYRAVADSIIEQSSSAGQVSFISGAWHPSYFDYYFQQRNSVLRVSATGKGRKQLARLARDTDAATVFVAAPVGKRLKNGGTLKVRGYTRASVEQFIGWELYRFSRN